MSRVAGVVFIILTLLPSAVLSATYTVTTSGNNSSCSNIGTVLYAINNCARNAGDIIDIRAGSYPEQWHGGINASWASGSSWSSPITIRGHVGETVVINPSSSGDFFDMVYIDVGQAEFISFENIIFDGSNLAMHQGGNIIRVGNNIRVESCILRNFLPLDPYNGQTFPPHSNGALVGSHNIIRNSEIHHVLYGVYLSKVDNIFENNYVHDTGGYGIHSFDGGIDPGTGQPWVCTHAPQTIRNNYVSHPGQNGPTPQTGGGIVVGQTDGTLVYNNVVVSAECDGCAGIQVYSRTCNTKVYNNTVVGNPGACVDVGTTAQGTNIQNNICYNNGQGVNNNGSGTTQANNSSNSSNPLFTPCADGNPYCLQTTSPAKTAGVTQAGFELDKAGNSRGSAGGNSSQGAYQFVEDGTPVPRVGTFYIAVSGVDAVDCDAAEVEGTARRWYRNVRPCALGGSTIVYAETGTYVEDVLSNASTPFPSGTSSSNRTTIKKKDGTTVTLKPETAGPVIYFNNSDGHIVVDGFVVDADNVSGTNGIAIGVGGSDIVIQNVEVKETYFEGVFVNGASDVMVKDSHIHHTVFTGTGVVGVFGSSTVTLQGVEVNNGAAMGVQVGNGSTGVTITRGDIHNNAGAGVSVGGNSGTVVVNNVIRKNGAAGTDILSSEGGLHHYNNSMYDNTGECVRIRSGASNTEVINAVCFSDGDVVTNAGTGSVLTTNFTVGDPLYVDAEAGNLHLQDGSTAKAAGTNLIASGVSTDYDGNGRTDPMSQGAFENDSPPPPEGVLSVSPRGIMLIRRW